MKLSEKLGLGAVELPRGNVATWRASPEDTDEFRRIWALPRRTLTPSLEQAKALTAEFKRGVCEDPKCPHLGGFWPIQAASIAEGRRVGGGFYAIGVGWGKTLIGLMLPTAMGVRSAVLLVPPQLRDQLKNRDYPHLAKHYRLPNLAGTDEVFKDVSCWLHVVAYTELQSTKRSDLLERIRPELIVADEAHSIRDASATRTKRFRRYFKAYPETKFVAMSGTLTSRSIRDYAHLSHLSLKNNSPLPFVWRELEQWAGVLDANASTPPGVLARFGEPVRTGFRRRQIETPGVVATEESALGTSLVLRARTVAIPSEVDRVLRSLRDSWSLPHGETFSDILTLGRAARQLACGFYYRWVWPNGVDREWLEARKNWNAEVRSFLQHRSRQWLDSPALLAMAAERGALTDKPSGRVWPTDEGPAWKSETWGDWKAVKDRPPPPVEPVWVSDYLVRDAIGLVGNDPVIVWYEHDAFGRRLAELAGWKHLGADSDEELRAVVQGPLRPLVVSIKAHGTGKDGLQKWSRNLIVPLPSSGAGCEQLLGRTHRSGQTADEVEATIYTHTPELQRSVTTAFRDARYIEESFGQRQKLSYATLVDFDFVT